MEKDNNNNKLQYRFINEERYGKIEVEIIEIIVNKEDMGKVNMIIY